jgi:hypothetical protein
MQVLYFFISWISLFVVICSFFALLTFLVLASFATFGVGFFARPVSNTTKNHGKKKEKKKKKKTKTRSEEFCLGILEINLEEKKRWLLLCC